jgi:hypothetical protein
MYVLHNIEALSRIIIAVEEQYYIFVSVCVHVALLIRHEKLYVPYCDVISVPSDSTTIFHIISYTT